MTGAALPLHKYQRDWFTDREQHKVGMFSRQSGKTFTTSLEVVDDIYEAWSRKKRTRWVYLSRGERQGKEAMTEALIPHARAYDMSVDMLEGEFKSEDGKNVYKSLEIVLHNGSRVIALPANPDTARGYSANVVLDEFALHKKSRDIWGALYPIISAGWKIRVTSTPQGKGNKFYDLMTGTDGLWSRHEVDIHRAVADGLPRDIEMLRTGLGDEPLWRQEYLLHWLDEASAWLTYDTINACEAQELLPFDGALTVIGNDIARRKHLWVAWVMQLIGDVLWTVEIVELQDASFAEQDRVLDELVEKYRPYRIVMDQTGMGEKPVEDAKRRYGDLRTEGVILTAPSRLNLATIFRARFEDRKIRIPAGNQALRDDLHAVRKTASLVGAPRLLVDEDAGESHSHADRFWAGALATGAVDWGIVKPAYTPVTPPGGGPESRQKMNMRPDHSDDMRRGHSINPAVGHGFGRRTGAYG